jgi:nucleoid-associated protein YgaU
MTSTTLERPTTVHLRTTPRPAPTRSRPTRPTATLARPQASTQPPPVMRLTRRGRLVVVLTVLVATLGFFAMRGAPAASTDVVHHPRTTTVIVSPGQTVWDIANQVAPQADTRSMVAEIEELNSLSDAGSIRVGQPLLVPAG